MMLLIILLIISVALNIALVFGKVRRDADEEMIKIRMKEGLRVE
ncbi:MAG: hypothetical protein DAHOPDDO_00349 [Ignavibacteriaceae bacterium]|jgi:hypothetical protein|nr:hypothetical protein [Ignavibacteriaceae bacterium]MCZ7612025.1 hypothetical protein [Ignavibacteriaceae bacterium]MEB2295642.1 hypothetical protein [Ignavibacteria bacterium]